MHIEVESGRDSDRDSILRLKSASVAIGGRASMYVGTSLLRASAGCGPYIALRMRRTSRAWQSRLLTSTSSVISCPAVCTPRSAGACALARRPGSCASPTGPHFARQIPVRPVPQFALPPATAIGVAGAQAPAAQRFRSQVADDCQLPAQLVPAHLQGRRLPAPGPPLLSSHHRVGAAGSSQNCS